jgi:hypothetical protein
LSKPQPTHWLRNYNWFQAYANIGAYLLRFTSKVIGALAPSHSCIFWPQQLRAAWSGGLPALQ